MPSSSREQLLDSELEQSFPASDPPAYSGATAGPASPEPVDPAAQDRSVSRFTISPAAARSTVAPLLMRLSLAVVFFPHGAQKVLGWFGGAGYSDSMAYFTGTLGLAAPVVVLVMGAELLGPLALCLGFATRLVSLALAAVMLGAIWMVHAEHGFFMNWTGAAGGEGFEYHLLAIGLCLGLFFCGAGRLSLDHWIHRAWRRPARGEG